MSKSNGRKEDSHVTSKSPSRSSSDLRSIELDFSSEQLFGRDAELETLRAIKATNGRSLVSIHGLSGSGKTSVCHAAFSQDQHNDMFVIEGKFEQFVETTSVPYSAIVNAFDQLGGKLDGYQDEMKECLQYEGNILKKLIPSFSVYDTDVVEDNVDGDKGDAFTYATERLAIAFRSFLRIFTVKVRPLVVFVDDWQWNDHYSRELMASLLRDDELTNFVLVVAFREESLDEVRPFLESINDTDVIVTDVALKDLELDAVNSFLASTLSQSEEKTRSLAGLIHRKTAGNPYFVIQLLKQLHAQEILSYNVALIRWEWDIERAIAGTNVSDNLVDVIAARIQGVPVQVQRVLVLAACLGFVVDMDLLCQVEMGMRDTEILSTESADTPASGQSSGEVSREVTFDNAVARAEREGFVERTGTLLKFSHDQIRQGFYDMVGEVGSRDRLHHEIGCYLRKNNSDSNQVLLQAVDQLNRGSSLVTTDEDRISLIKLNYEACQAARQNAGVQAISYFLHKAIALVQPSFWLYYYDLVLEVYNLSAEIDFSLGMFDQANASVTEIMEHTTHKVDKIRAMVVEFQMFGVQCEFAKAIEHGGRVLKLLGEPIPKKVTLLDVAMEYFKARREAKNKPDEFFTKLPGTESSNIKTVLRILQVGSVYGWNADVNFAGFAMLRGFRISIREGASDSTPFLYCGYGFMLGLFGQYNEAFRFGQLGQVTRKSKETFPSAVNLNYMSLAHLQRPVGVGLEPYLSAYRVGLETGDLFFGAICLSCYVLLYWHCGLPLRSFACDLRNFAEQLSICHQDLQLAWLLSAHQLALNLMGESDDPLDFSREAIIRYHEDIFSDNLLQQLDDDSTRVVNADILFTLYLQLYAAYILEDIVVVDKTLKRLLKLKPVSRRFGGSHATNYFLPLIDGLAGLFLCKMKPKSKTGPRVTKSAIAELAKLSKTCPINSITSLKLLKAEVAARKQSTSAQQARMNYNEVINEFSRSGLNHFCAMANEMAGKNMLERQDQERAEFYLENALRKWHEYDATVKVERLVKAYSFLEPVADGLYRDGGQTYSIQGRARFNARTDSLNSKGMNSSHQLSAGRLVANGISIGNETH